MARLNKIKSPEEFIDRAEKYFQDCEKNGTPLTISGLALAEGLSLKSLSNYENREEFADAVGWAKTYITNNLEKLLLTKGVNATGPTFLLRAINREVFGDKSSVDVTSGGKTIKQNIFIMPNADEDAEE